MKALKAIVLMILLVKSLHSYSQACPGPPLNNSEITGTAAFCSDTGIVFCNSLADGSVNPAITAAPGPYYSCLSQQPYPSWFFIRVDNPGSLDLTIQQNNLAGTPIDVDFIIWGPYSDTEIDNIRGGDYSLLDQPSVRDCSYSSSATEYLNVNPVLTGEFYIILITNFKKQPGTISMVNTNPSNSNGATTDCSILSSTLGADQKVCNGTNITLDATPSIGTATGYKWFLDTGSGFNELIGETSATLYIDNDTTGIYKVEVTDNSGGVDTDEVLISFFPNPVANNVNDILHCDADGDGFHTFDLENTITPLVLNGQDPNQFEVIYYANSVDANANISGNALSTNYTNSAAFGSDTIFARIHNTNAPTACYEITQFAINVSSQPQVTQLSDYEVCDDSISGSDTDGIFNSFDLASLDSQILGSLSPNDYSISYHTTLIGAQTSPTSDVINKNVLYTNTTAYNQTIYVRVENSLNSSCSIISDPTSATFEPFNLIVNSPPTVTNSVDLRVCDNDMDLSTLVDLTSVQPDISINHTNENFKYYPSENDAINDTNPITNPTNQIVSNNDVLWVKTISNNQCFKISSIHIKIGIASDISYNKQFYECDDFLDTNGNDTPANNNNLDGITNFDLSSVITDIKLFYPIALQSNISILVFETIADRNAGTNPISDLPNYRNVNLPALTAQTLYVKIVDINDASCFGFAEFTIHTGIPEANTVSSLIFCDDSDSGSTTDGEVVNINLQSKITDILGSQQPSDYTVSFHTNSTDALSASNPIINTSSFRNTAPNGFIPGTISQQTIYVAVKNNSTGCINHNTQFDIIVYPKPKAHPTNDILHCDTDDDGFHTFNLETLSTPSILNGQDPALFEVIYYSNITDANANITNNALANNYINSSAFSIDSIFARVHNINAPTLCYEITEFKLGVTEVPKVFQPSDYMVCDDLVSGSDTDGIYNSFYLASKDSEILGNISNTNFSVTYHTTLLGAQTSSIMDSVDKTVPFANTTANNQTIYVRVENIQNSNCFVVSEPNSSTFKPFDLIVHPIPNVANAVELKFCDSDADLTTIVDLTQAQNIISTNAFNETFKYYITESDAINDSNSIPTPTSYSVSHNDTVWVRTMSSDQCYGISSIKVSVSFASDVTYNKQFYECDDFLDIDGNDVNGSNDNTDGVTFFNLSSVESDIKSFFPSDIQSNLNILVFESESERTIGTNPISDLTNYRNKNLPALTPQSLFVKIINTNNPDCFGYTEFTILTGIPNANSTTPLVYCDDEDSGANNDGEVVGIDLRSKVPAIIGLQNPSNFTVTFHTNFNDALSASNPILNDQSFRNSAPANFIEGTVSQQTIYVAIKDNTTGCINPNIELDIIVNPLPMLTHNLSAIEVCDVGSQDNDTQNRIEQNIDLSQRFDEILNGRDSSDFEISFHKTESDSYNGLNPVDLSYDMDPANTTVTDNIGEEILWVSIKDVNTGCISGGTPLILRVFTEPNLPTSISNYMDCDHDNGGFGNATDGIIENINFSTKIPEILTNYGSSNFSDFEVTFHESITDANLGNNPLNYNQYTNLSNPQTVYVRVEDKQSGCYNSNLSFEIIINELPYFEINTPQTLCLNNAPLSISIENPSGNFAYEWVILNSLNTPISTNEYADIYSGGNYIVSATNIITGCKSSLEITINESDIPSISNEDITVIDATNNNGDANYSITIDNANNNLGVGDYEFALENENGDITTFQDDPEFNNLEGGIYTLHIQDKNDCGKAEIIISVIHFPKFFTPNQDGYNDTWVVKGVNKDNFPIAELVIFDRFGKVLIRQNINDDIGWDGSYNGQTLPSNDYWFKVILTDTNDKTLVSSGHFSLLRN